jgi:hypothetical protein
MPPQLIYKTTFKAHQKQQKEIDDQIIISNLIAERENAKVSTTAPSSSLLSSSSSSSLSSSLSSSSSSSTNDDEPLPVNILSQSLNKDQFVFDRNDIDIPISPSVPIVTALHIERLLQIRAHHKAPKEMISDMLAYMHDAFKGSPGIHELPKTWRQCETAIKHVKPTFIKVYF